MPSMNKIPELLIPAGSLDKLKVAYLYGADAVYLGGQKFGLRAAADNFTLDELVSAAEFAKKLKRKIYVVLNGYLYDKDLEDLPDFVKFLEKIGIDAVIVSDPGVAKVVTQFSSISIHVSTQASVLNASGALWWKDLGAKRIVLGREVSILEASKIKETSGLEIEMFIHGSMCMAFSGHCVISNFTQGRDSNRGGCAHSCRFEYSLNFEDLQNKEKIKAYFMSSKDLMGIQRLYDFAKAGIDSLKVEGRMKSPLYAATTAAIYQSALKYLKDQDDIYAPQFLHWEKELNKIPHRDYTEASLVNKAQEDSIFNSRENASEAGYEMSGIIKEISHQSMIIEVKNAFNIGDELELLDFNGQFQKIKIVEMTDLFYRPVERTKPSTLVRLPKVPGAMSWQLLRKGSLA